MEVFIADEQNEAEVDVERLLRLARFVLEEERVLDDAELSVRLVDEETMAGLNKTFLGADGPTDVLAFPIDEGFEPEPVETGPGGRVQEIGDAPLVLGDVVICPKVAQSQAESGAGSYRSEMDLLFVHGLLHLLGYDHPDSSEPDGKKIAAEMARRESELLKTFAKRETGQTHQRN